jgi:hypothetical protein
MPSEVNHSIQGSWRGRYFYAGDGVAHAWEAVFLEVKGIIEGSILDDDALGEALAGGTFSYPVVRFTKVYRRTGTHPIKYEGTMSEDGNLIRGRWVIEGAVSGTWLAMRHDHADELQFEKWEQEQRDSEKEKVLLSRGPH